MLDIDHVGRGRRSTLPADLPSRRVGVAYPPARVVALLEQVGCRSPRAPTGSPRTRARSRSRPIRDALAVTPPTWRPDLTDPADLVEEVVRLDGYDKVPSAAAAGPGRPGADRRSSAGAGPSPGRWPRPATSRCCPTRSWRPSCSTRSACPADDPRRTRGAAGQPAVRRGAAAAHHAARPAAGDAAPQPRPGPARPGALRDGRGVPARAGAGSAAGDGRRPAADRRRVRRRRRGACPDQPWHVAVVLAGEVEPAGWWGPGRAAGWADAVEAARTVLAAAGIPAERVAVRRPASARRGTPAAAPSCWSTARSVGYAGELHPAVVAALELPRAHQRDGARPGRAAAGPGGAGARDLRLPAGADRRGAGGGRRGAGRRGAGGARRGRR